MIREMVTSTVCVPPFVPTVIFFNVTGSPVCWAFLKANGNSLRSPSRIIANIFQLVFPAAGSKYLPVRPVIYTISPFSVTITLAGEKFCRSSWSARV
ncbi:MAG: hypothetical protein ACD_59C00064G0001 [uncultured bacterium]|nr:MAG: hypothetical protein ACD_59C00064G0001 [uncultured bacterium]